MKRYIKTVLVAAGMAGSFASCTDLDTPITGQYTKIPDNPIAYYSEFEGCYYYTRNEAWFGRNFWEAAFLCTDEALGICRGADYDESGRYRDGSLHNFRPDLQGVGLMGDMMSGISYTNIRIGNLGGEDGKAPIIAPLRAIRAYYTFWMMEFYGDVPILDRVMKDGEAVERKPRAEVARWIESELLDVLSQVNSDGTPALTEANDYSTYGRPNRWMAEALLAKLYLNWGVYTNPITQVTGSTPNEKLDACIERCDNLIKCQLFEVGNGYRRKFFPDNGLHIKDFIYAVPFDPATLGKGYWGGMEMNRFWDYRLPGVLERTIWGWDPKNSLAGNFILTPECVDRFCLEGDERNDMVAVGKFGGYDREFNRIAEPIKVLDPFLGIGLFPLDFKKEFEWVDITKLNVGSGTSEDDCMKGARLFKYPPLETDYIDNNRFQANDMPVFRLADILLMKAECILRGGTATEGDTPASLMNQVRACAHAPLVTADPTLDELLDERSRELILEPWRRNDLIRFGKFENCAKWKVQASPATMADVNRRLFPIPTGELNTNTNWTQNPGY